MAAHLKTLPNKRAHPAQTHVVRMALNKPRADSGDRGLTRGFFPMGNKEKTFKEEKIQTYLGAPMTDLKFTTSDKLDCIKREIGKRKYVYPRLVQEGKLSEAKANREIACMEAIAADLETEAAKERLL